MAQVVNGQISFGNGTSRDNINGNWVAVADTGAANADFTVNHNLGRLPVGYWAMTKNQAGDIYTGSVAATTSQITLRCSAANSNIKLFII